MMKNGEVGRHGPLAALQGAPWGVLTLGGFSFGRPGPRESGGARDDKRATGAQNTKDTPGARRQGFKGLPARFGAPGEGLKRKEQRGRRPGRRQQACFCFAGGGMLPGAPQGQAGAGAGDDSGAGQDKAQDGAGVDGGPGLSGSSQGGPGAQCAGAAPKRARARVGRYSPGWD